MAHSRVLVRLAIPAAAAALLPAVALTKPDSLSFGAYDFAELAQMLAPLVLVSLFVERTLEVFLALWRGPEAEKLKLELLHIREPADSGGSPAELRAAEGRLLTYKSETRKLALIGGAVIGMVVSALGIHALEMFIDADSYYQLSGFQLTAFEFVDILVTGMIVSGVAHGLHSMIAAFGSAQIAIRRRAEGVVL